VDRVIQFFSLLKHSKGEWAGHPFVPEDWQRFILASVFGWEREDGTRRFRIGYVSTARKSGKSTLGAGVGLYGTLADGEPRAECYSAATKREQARITHGEAVWTVLSSPELKPLVTRFKDNLSITRPFPSGTGIASPLNPTRRVVLKNMRLLLLSGTVSRDYNDSNLLQVPRLQCANCQWRDSP
jgi:hypothetical protein